MAGQWGRYVIRPMRRAEVDIAVDWAAKEGWNPGLGDAGCFHAADPKGFLVGLLDGAPVASISVVKYGESFGFLGFYIVKDGFRGHGRGIEIWRAGMAYLAGRLVGLDGVVDQQANYKKSGFVLAHRSVRYGGALEVADPPGEADGVVEVSALPFARLAAYDRAFFPAPREVFLDCWLRPGARVGRALLSDGALAGYGVIRECRSGYKIGPLFAEDEAGADTLLRALAAEARGAQVFLDPPEPNAAAVVLAERYGLAPVFETARMYTGAAPELPLQRTFGITTFELG